MQIKSSYLLVPLFYQQHINQHTQIAIWNIDEDEDFFLKKVTIHSPITNVKKRLQHVAARYLLNVLTDSFSYENIRITESGKPLYHNNEFYFSLSHCSHFAAAIISTEKKVGVDIELRENKVEKILHKFLYEIEIEAMQNKIVKESFTDLPTVLWSAKETLFKYYGEGNVDFKSMLKIYLDSFTKDYCNCEIIAKTILKLKVHYKIFDNLCLTYCIED